MRAGHLESRAKAVARRITTPAMRGRLRRVYERFRPAARLDTRPLVNEPNALTDFNFLLHELRGAHLSRVSTMGTFLSAGCAGRWYFDWVDDRVGPIQRHIGLEAFSPEPADLPDHVTWIANDTADMHDVGSETVDVVFSGQNVEHLWPEQVVGFLLEANRVLVDGGTIVVDSPNQIVTELLGWSHPEHTIELTASEAEQLLEAAGFRVDSTEGLWLCRSDGTALPLFPAETDLARRLERIVDRTALAAGRPDDSFVWWCVATKVGKPEVARLTQKMAQLFETHWPARCSRFVAHRPVDEQNGTRVARAGAGESGLVATSPMFPLRKGVWRARLDVFVADAHDDGDAAVVDIVVGADVEHPMVSTGVPATAGRHPLELEMKVDTTTFGVQVCVTSTGRAAVAVPFSLRMEQLPA